VLLETLPTGQFDVHAPCASLRDGLGPTLLRESPSRAKPRSGDRQAGLQPSWTPMPVTCGFTSYRYPF